MQQLLFAPFNKKGKPVTLSQESDIEYDYPKVREFKVENLQVRILIFNLDQGVIKEGKTLPLKYTVMKIVGFGMPALDYTLSGLPSADTPVIKLLCGDPEKGKYGKAYEFFKQNG